MHARGSRPESSCLTSMRRPRAERVWKRATPQGVREGTTASVPTPSTAQPPPEIALSFWLERFVGAQDRFSRLPALGRRSHATLAQDLLPCRFVRHLSDRVAASCLSGERIRRLSDGGARVRPSPGDRRRTLARLRPVRETASRTGTEARRLD